MSEIVNNYQTALVVTNARISKLRELIKQHNKDSKINPNGSFADLQFVNEKLNEIIKFLGSYE